MKKRRRSSGETLIETLAALLLMTLSSILFLQMTTTSIGISAEVKEFDELYRQAVRTAEQQIPPSSATGQIMVDGRSYQVDYFTQDSPGGELARSLVSYSAKEDEE